MFIRCDVMWCVYKYFSCYFNEDPIYIYLYALQTNTKHVWLTGMNGWLRTAVRLKFKPYIFPNARTHLYLLLLFTFLELKQIFAFLSPSCRVSCSNLSDFNYPVALTVYRAQCNHIRTEHVSFCTGIACSRPSYVFRMLIPTSITIRELNVFLSSQDLVWIALTASEKYNFCQKIIDFLHSIEVPAHVVVRLVILSHVVIYFIELDCNFFFIPCAIRQMDRQSSTRTHTYASTFVHSSKIKSMINTFSPWYLPIFTRITWFAAASVEKNAVIIFRFYLVEEEKIQKKRKSTAWKWTFRYGSNETETTQEETKKKKNNYGFLECSSENVNYEFYDTL